MKMDVSQKILSDITVYNKYAKFIPELSRRENWEEICERNSSMHIKKFPSLKKEIRKVYDEFVIPKKTLPSMRSMQFGGLPIELANNRIFNCAYVAIEDMAAFWETMFLLLGGSGVGFSVQKQHVNKLPEIKGPKDRSRRYLVGDSIEGWADSIKVLMEAYAEGKSDPVFDFRDIRKKGAMLITSGGKAPGPDPLRICIENIRSVLNDSVGRKLKSLECHDIMCHIADAVLSGGIRRAALISLFSKDDMDMLSCKSGTWWELNPQRGRANNSVVMKRGEFTKEEFISIWHRVEESRAGEPGFYWTNDEELGTNPCCEISLKSMQFCNVTEINSFGIVDQKDFNERAVAGAFLGTLQASYTDFHYLRPEWKENTEKDALLGVGITGTASGDISHLDEAEAARYAVAENKRVAALIGINESARVTTQKPSGTTSLVVGSSSGIHAWHNDYYIRRCRVGKNEAMYKYLIKNFPELVEDCYYKPHIEAVISFPQKAPNNATLRTESVFNLLERVKRYNLGWVRNGHQDGKNYNNVSCTISVQDSEWESVGEWMWENQDSYNGISVMPYDNGSYVQAPFEDCTKESYEEMVKFLHGINLNNVKEYDDNTTLNDQVACAGGSCEID